MCDISGPQPPPWNHGELSSDHVSRAPNVQEEFPRKLGFGWRFVPHAQRQDNHTAFLHTYTKIGKITQVVAVEHMM